MVPTRSRRLRLLESLCRTISDMLHDRVQRAAAARGFAPAPESTSAIYTLAKAEVPDLLDQLLLVHHRACEERGEATPGPDADLPRDDGERKRMLSAVRAAVLRGEHRFGS